MDAPARPPGHERTASDGERRFLFYSHDGLGLGHTRRNLAIARALVQLDPHASVLLATGADEINRYGIPAHVEVVKLPSLRKLANNQYDSRYLRVSTEKALAIRSSLLRATVESFQPDVILADKHPLGVGGELKDALAAHRRHGGVAVLGLRDILDDPATVIADWKSHQLQEAIDRHYDEILIYGQPEVFDAIGEYEFTRSLAGRSHYCGYVSNVAPHGVARDGARSALVLATPGGGEDGYRMVSAFIQAATGAPWKGWAVTGPMMPPPDQQRLRECGTREQVQVDTFLPNLPAEMAGIAAVVCMGGYNTLTEIAALGLRAVCVPRTRPRREQWIRACSFERLGLVKVVSPEDLAPDTLRMAIDDTLRHPPGTGCLPIRLDGAGEAARRLLRQAGQAARTFARPVATTTDSLLHS